MIAMRGVHKEFGANHVLQGVDLEVGKGTSMVIIGGSGTGKSVALKCILGLIRPDAGRILVDGKDAGSGDRDAFLARFGMLFQGGALFDSLPVWQNVSFRLLRGSLKRPLEEARAVAVDKLRRVGLKPEGRQPVRAGTPLFDADGNDAGMVTSGGFGPSAGGPVAMGYVPADGTEPGTTYFAEVRGNRIPVTVHPLPFTPHRYRKG